VLGDIEIRCPIYGFIPLDAWEHEVIQQPAFQRLRRIRQLAWTDYVYPGAMQTRFEHSLGVMHMIGMLYDGIVQRSSSMIQELGYRDLAKARYRKLLRLAALLHDVGHAPFSHAGEDILPENPTEGRPYQHEEYSAAVIRLQFKDLIENHKENANYYFTADEVASLVDGGPGAGRAALWRDLLSGQLDADRMDYLLRDSYHAGVEYGRYDWRRIVGNVTLVRDPESEAPKVGVSHAGRHAVEGMLIARYMMFNQVYYHHTRVILDRHLQRALESMLPGGKFPPPTPDQIADFLAWDDWRVLGAFAAGDGGDHGRRLRERDFFRSVWETAEFRTEEDEGQLNTVISRLGNLLAERIDAAKSWYKVGPSVPSGMWWEFARRNLRRHEAI
jgi:HD superfamily phosphohydrolase